MEKKQWTTEEISKLWEKYQSLSVDAQIAIFPLLFGQCHANAVYGKTDSFFDNLEKLFNKTSFKTKDHGKKESK